MVLLFQEFNTWLEKSSAEETNLAKDFFSVVRRRQTAGADSHMYDLEPVKYSDVYKEKLKEASRLLRLAGQVAHTDRCFLNSPLLTLCHTHL